MTADGVLDKAVWLLRQAHRGDWGQLPGEVWNEIDHFLRGSAMAWYQCYCPGGGGYWGRQEHLSGCISANAYKRPECQVCEGAIVGLHYHHETADGDEIVRLSEKSA